MQCLLALVERPENITADLRCLSYKCACDILAKLLSSGSSGIGDSDDDRRSNRAEAARLPCRARASIAQARARESAGNLGTKKKLIICAQPEREGAVFATCRR